MIFTWLGLPTKLVKKIGQKFILLLDEDNFWGHNLVIFVDVSYDRKLNQKSKKYMCLQKKIARLNPMSKRNVCQKLIAKRSWSLQ